MTRYRVVLADNPPKQGDAVLVRGKIISIDGNFATVGTSSTDFAIVPLSAVVKGKLKVEERKWQ